MEYLISFGIYILGVIISTIVFKTINYKVKNIWYHTDDKVFFQQVVGSWLVIVIFIGTILLIKFGGCRKGIRANYRWYYN